jgi:hypothetical protein
MIRSSPPMTPGDPRMAHSGEWMSYSRAKRRFWPENKDFAPKKWFFDRMNRIDMILWVSHRATEITENNASRKDPKPQRKTESIICTTKKREVHEEIKEF